MSYLCPVCKTKYVSQINCLRCQSSHSRLQSRSKEDILEAWHSSSSYDQVQILKSILGKYECPQQKLLYILKSGILANDKRATDDNFMKFINIWCEKTELFRTTSFFNEHIVPENNHIVSLIIALFLDGLLTLHSSRKVTQHIGQYQLVEFEKQQQAVTAKHTCYICQNSYKSRINCSRCEWGHKSGKHMYTAQELLELWHVLSMEERMDIVEQSLASSLMVFPHEREHIVQMLSCMDPENFFDMICLCSEGTYLIRVSNSVYPHIPAPNELLEFVDAAAAFASDFSNNLVECDAARMHFAEASAHRAAQYIGRGDANFPTAMACHGCDTCKTCYFSEVNMQKCVASHTGNTNNNNTKKKKQVLYSRDAVHVAWSSYTSEERLAFVIGAMTGVLPVNPGLDSKAFSKVSAEDFIAFVDIATEGTYLLRSVLSQETANVTNVHGAIASVCHALVTSVMAEYAAKIAQELEEAEWQSKQTQQQSRQITELQRKKAEASRKMRQLEQKKVQCMEAELLASKQRQQLLEAQRAEKQMQQRRRQQEEDEAREKLMRYLEMQREYEDQALDRRYERLEAEIFGQPLKPICCWADEE